MAQELTDNREGCNPCPYCGAEGEQLLLYSCGYHHIECVICFATGPRGSTPEIAVEGWNTRVAPPTIKQRDRFKHDDAARKLYDTWRDQPGWVPWVERGNSLMQMKARREASQ